ncbi:hypothetical protein H920_13168 [Fukomys damarensis]|uniref:Uncharacterized protein n=1 Tax=Fukomys damarensis TaxID=885580 RepID=A0A091D318_FUKDA|nr:hypothetical protein H920_13168 [Fukomys damarensis]
MLTYEGHLTEQRRSLNPHREALKNRRKPLTTKEMRCALCSPSALLGTEFLPPLLQEASLASSSLYKRYKLFPSMCEQAKTYDEDRRPLVPPSGDLWSVLTFTKICNSSLDQQTGRKRRSLQRSTKEEGRSSVSNTDTEASVTDDDNRHRGLSPHIHKASAECFLRIHLSSLQRLRGSWLFIPVSR